MTRQRAPGWRFALKGVVLLLPFLWAAVLVGRYGVDVPYTDQWVGEYPLFEAMDRGTLGPGNFFAPHNEHRIFFPRLVFYGLARLTHWNVRAELWVILGLAATMAFNVWRTLRATGWRGTEGPGFWLLLAANVLIFSPLHRENMLWGFQIGFLLPLACLTACLWVGRAGSPRVRFAGTFALSVVCSFSIGGGLLCWLICLPLLIQAGGKGTWTAHRPGWLAWAAGFAGSVALYLHGFAFPAGAGKQVFFHEPVLAAKYWLTYLGLPFAFGTALDPFTVAQVSAAAMLLLFAGTLGYLWRWRADAALRQRCLPWVVLVFITLSYAAITTVGRVDLGLWQALTSRYVIFAVLLPIGLTVIAATVYQHLRARRPAEPATGRAGAGLVALGSCFALLHLLGACKVAPGWREFSFSLLKSKALVETVNVVDEPELFARDVYLKPLRAEITRLDHLGYLRPPLVGSAFIDAIVGTAGPTVGDTGQFEQAARGPDGSLGMRGWAMLPGKDRPADAVLLTCDDAQGRAVIFALAETGAARPDLVEAGKTRTPERCGWQKLVKPDRAPAGGGTLRAWSFDAETGRAYRLAGQGDVR